MSNLFIGLFFIACLGLIIGLAKPHKFKKVFKGNSSRKVVGTTLGIVVVFLLVMIGVASPTPAPHKDITPTSTLRTVSSSKVSSPNPVVTTKNITTTQPIAFTSTTEQDASLASGTTTVKTAGVNGVQTQTWQVTYSNGAEKGRKLVSTVTTTQPTTEVIEQGTYVAPKPIPKPTPAPVPAPIPPKGCYPLTNAGNCYEPGEYCRDSDHDASGVAGDGKSITCLDNDGWRWEP